MDLYTRKKLNKILSTTAITLAIVAIIVTIIYILTKKEEQKVVYEDTIVNNNYFVDISINLEKKTVSRDNNKTTLKDEFKISEDKENEILQSEENIRNFFQNTVYEIQNIEGTIHIRNEYQTKKLIIEVQELKQDFDAEKVNEIQENLYILNFDTRSKNKSSI